MKKAYIWRSIFVLLSVAILVAALAMGMQGIRMTDNFIFTTNPNSANFSLTYRLVAVLLDFACLVLIGTLIWFWSTLLQLNQKWGKKISRFFSKQEVRIAECLEPQVVRFEDLAKKADDRIEAWFEGEIEESEYIS